MTKLVQNNIYYTTIIQLYHDIWKQLNHNSYSINFEYKKGYIHLKLKRNMTQAPIY